MEPDFPIEFIVYGTPVSQQSTNPRAKSEWQSLIREAIAPKLPEMHFATDRPLAVTLYYFPAAKMAGDVDNIVKWILDALKRYVYIDDKQVERLVVQKFDPSRAFAFSAPSETLNGCMLGRKPALYVRISDDLSEGL